MASQVADCRVSKCGLRPRCRDFPARKRRHFQMKLTEEEKYSFQVIKINDYRASTSRRKTAGI